MRNEITPLTSIRGFAALAVVAMHFSATMQTLTKRPIPSLAPHGYLAVDLFFVLSGFIMAYTYLSSFERLPLGEAYRSFLSKRVARIIPLNLFVVCILFAAFVLMRLAFGIRPYQISFSDMPVEFLANTSMLSGLGIGHSINWPAWSISVEFLAYLIFPVLAFVIFHKRPAISAVGLALALTVLVAICIHHVDLAPIAPQRPFTPTRIARCVCEFTLGLAAYRAFRSEQIRDLVSADVIVAVCLVGILSLIVLKIGDLFAILLFPPLVFGISLNQGYSSKFLSMKIPYLLGKWSFAVYMVHDNFRYLARKFVVTFFGPSISPHLALGLAAVFALTMLIPAWLCYTYVERPSRQFLRRFLLTSGERPELVRS